MAVDAVATISGRGISQFVIGWAPGEGKVANPATAATTIETVGWAMAADFANRDNS